MSDLLLDFSLGSYYLFSASFFTHLIEISRFGPGKVARTDEFQDEIKFPLSL